MENRKIKILIVEDELIIAKSLARQLERQNYEIVGVASFAEKAMELVRKEAPDLVLMDIVIAGEIDGIETATEIHQEFDIPVIYLTAYSDNETLKRAQQSGSYGYILKPYKQREVHAAITMALNQHQSTVNRQT